MGGQTCSLGDLMTEVVNSAETLDLKNLCGTMGIVRGKENNIFLLIMGAIACICHLQ